MCIFINIYIYIYIYIYICISIYLSIYLSIYRNPLKNYWILKIFKYPSKARFLIAAPQCSSKTLTKALGNVLILMYKQIETSNSESHH